MITTFQHQWKLPTLMPRSIHAASLVFFKHLSFLSLSIWFSLLHMSSSTTQLMVITCKEMVAWEAGKKDMNWNCLEIVRRNAKHCRQFVVFGNQNFRSCLCSYSGMEGNFDDSFDSARGPGGRMSQRKEINEKGKRKLK